MTTRGEALQRSLLAVFAHPDDESYGPGGTLAKYAAEGVSVNLVCATLGEEGTLGDPPICTREELGEVREGELRCACRALGVNEILLLGYRDSTLDKQEPAGIEEKIVRAIRRFRPQVVMTFPPDGVTGHPDHVTINQCTVRAFEQAGDGTRFRGHLEEGLNPHDPGKLYYTALTSDKVRAFGLDLQAHDEHITTTIDVSGFVDSKMRAVRCHRTQLDFPELNAEEARQLLSEEHFWLAHPGQSYDQRETELFQGTAGRAGGLRGGNL